MKYEIDVHERHLAWTSNDEYHRLYGSAIEYTYGSREWWIFGWPIFSKNIINYHEI